MSISAIGGAESPFSIYDKDKARQNLQGNSSLMGASAAIDPSVMNVPTADADDPVKQFTDYMKLTPEQRWQQAWLQRHGITQEEFDAMSAEDKRKIMEQMRADMERDMKDKADAKAKATNTDLLV
jgi:hypothetical protein